ncbi:hypothetical protein [Fictibacillus enclensis]|uniref:hypothetical protein n=1 Tax=Fictibacillus enclensis TaxID=1017270 RepID=UPI0025A07177|nr:hypothetical protein [Fictibacillus enclensis]
MKHRVWPGFGESYILLNMARQEILTNELQGFFVGTALLSYHFTFLGIRFLPNASQ